MKGDSVGNAQDAQKAFKDGLNCSQAILATYGPARGLEQSIALRLGGALGAGVGRTGRICGAANGACMILGLRHGGGWALASREKALQEAARFLDLFEARLGSVECKALIGCSLRTPADRSKAREQGLFDTKCALCVRTAGEILDGMLAE